MTKTLYRGQTFTTATTLVVEQCCHCGMTFAMTDEFQRKKLNARGTKDAWFYCPAGHSQHYTGQTEADKLRQERDRLKQNAAYLQDRATEAEKQARHERARANGYKGHATKITKRAKAGVCPCCNRHFAALERHMATKHPTFTPLELEGGPA